MEEHTASFSVNECGSGFFYSNWEEQICQLRGKVAGICGQSKLWKREVGRG